MSGERIVRFKPEHPSEMEEFFEVDTGSAIDPELIADIHETFHATVKAAADRIRLRNLEIEEQE